MSTHEEQGPPPRPSPTRPGMRPAGVNSPVATIRQTTTDRTERTQTVPLQWRRWCHCCMRCMAGQWKEIAAGLGFDEDMIDEIFTNNQTDELCLLHMVEIWVSKLAPSWETLSLALRDMGRNDLAHKICSEGPSFGGLRAPQPESGSDDRGDDNETRGGKVTVAGCCSGEVLEKGPAYFYQATALNPVIEDYLIEEEVDGDNTETGSFVEPVSSSEEGDKDGMMITGRMGTKPADNDVMTDVDHTLQKRAQVWSSGTTDLQLHPPPAETTPSQPQSIEYIFTEESHKPQLNIPWTHQK